MKLTHTHTHTQTHKQVRLQIPEPPRNEFEVIAMYNYPGLERGDLPITKGEHVDVLDDSVKYWWRARNQHG